MTGNNLTVVDQTVLTNLTHLRWLILNLNVIRNVTPTAFNHMTSLTRLQLAYNRWPKKGSGGLDPHTFTTAVNALNKTLRVLEVNFTQFAAADVQ
jgi:hypothetical protein